MKCSLNTGIPNQNEYKAVLETDVFKHMEAYSDEFLRINASYLDAYSRKVVRDPFHQWSRQWEYPFTYCKIQSESTEAKHKIRLLDAGSGVTFFPYYVQSCSDIIDVYCCDYDPDLKDTFDHINQKLNMNIGFSCADLRNTGYEDGSFDIIYCISVLEHTEKYSEIIEEFYRLLRPNGKLVVTFDISLDGRLDINPSGAANLISSLMTKFSIDDDLREIDIERSALKTDNFTTQSALEINSNLIPWKRPSFMKHLKSVIKGRGEIAFPPLLTVCCLNLRKF